MPLCPIPPDPPVGTPAPTPAPVPVPPAPTPAPTPAPAPGEPEPPAYPEPPAQIVFDWSAAGSFISSVDSACSFTIPMSWAFINSAPVDGSTCGLHLKLKNLSAVSGTLNFAVRAMDGRLTVYDGTQSVVVAAGGFAVAVVTFQIGNGSTDPGTPGAYVVEIEDSNGATVTFTLVMGPGLPPLSTIGPAGVPSGYCPQEFIGAGA